MLTALKAMNVFFKILVAVLTISLIIISALVLWYDREQYIDFVERFPDYFETCHGTVSGTSSELIAWFSANKDGWQNNPASLAPGYLYRSSELNINVHPNSVVVNYSKNGDWQQVMKHTPAALISKECGSGS
ncbi:hypothetical protein ISG33_14425 [Glaciecola sp. MH2013]|uniref:hypothetical protein n=1 Tax=Glaciecola sp. MH2013 TaxID=2785524 RepID=UPI00189E6899|nr:hypothetical protein [Glaciecola sp. MH2013]MBF7074598.1 hypothetical protein [Glaciecola sp. MH2013]